MSQSPSSIALSALLPLDPAHGVEARGLGKRYRVTTESVGRAASLFWSRWASRGAKRDLWAVRDVDLDVHRGRILGVVGANGSGKSTLLRLLTGISKPTTGTVRRAPRVAALLDLTAGFHPNLTGYENLFLGGSLMGISREEMRALLPQIVAFAEVDRDYLDQPVRRYSSGMLTRLGFALAVSCDPDVVLVDEVLAVGDAAFQARSARRLLEFKDEGRAMVLVSHLVSVVQQISSEVLWMEAGRMRTLGPAEEVSREYEAEINARIRRRKAEELLEEDAGTQGQAGSDSAAPVPGLVEFRTVELDDGAGRRPEWFLTREVMRVKAVLRALQPVENAELVVRVVQETGPVVDEFPAGERGAAVPEQWRGTLRVAVTFEPLLLLRGRYFLVLSLVDRRNPSRVLAESAEIPFEVETPFFTNPGYAAELACRFEVE